MKFKITTIPPEGRNEYGNYYSSDQITKNVMRVTYDGNASTGGNKPKDPVVPPQDSVILFLSKTSLKYDGKEVAGKAVTQSVDVLGYVNSRASDTYVGDLTNEEATNYGIIGLPEKGMTITVSDNGTPNAKVNITINDEIKLKTGSLIIPCTVNKKPDDTPIGEDWEDWSLNEKNNMTLILECQWEVSEVYENRYVLELSNEIAGINCDAEGNILAGATRPTCTAELFLGSTKVPDAKYGFTTPDDKNATGISIDTDTGILTFGSNFSFDGTTLEVKITATSEGYTASKIMSISKQFPGVDGTPATTRWVVPSHNSITYNPNNGTISPSSITCKCMKQVGEKSPVVDTGTTIYYGYDTTNPLTKYTAAISPDVSKSYLVFGIKNAAGEIYEIETIQIIKEGKDGANGQDGTDGKDGANGESVYRLDLTNDNAGINCDADGNIYATAYRPKCTATLYYGTKKASNVKYSITKSVSTTGLTIAESTGVLTFGDDFNFDIASTTLEITVEAKINNVLYGSAIMTVSRNYAGRNGTDGKDGADGINGADGVNGQDGTPILWKGSSATHPSNAQNGWAYYNTSDKKSYVYQDGQWYQMTVDGVDGQNGKDGTSIQIAGTLPSESELPTPPANTNDCYVIGNDIYVWTGSKWKNCGQFTGQDGTSMIWKGNHASHPSNPQNGWCYYNTSDKKSYTYSDGQWYIMTTDGVDGADGVSITWKGDLKEPPTNPQINWCYRDTDNGKVYIYNGSAWELMVVDGSNGIDGANGADGMSVYITYHDNPNTLTPSSPTGNGTSGGWHTYATTSVNWMSQKVASAATAGTWGAPIRLTGFDGTDGINGVDGANGVNGEDGVSIVWKGSSITHPANPQNGWAYYNTAQKKSFIYQDGAWYQMTVDGTDGQDGKDGQDGTNGLSIVWKGESATAPANPKENWCYKDTDNGKVYIYNGLAWELMVLDGSDGEDGADGQDGKDGLSVFITYHDNAITSTPANPTGNGTTGGWHTNATKAANWMSQKVASAATAGTWGAPIQICGADGQDGADGTNGSNGEDAVTYWLEFSADAFQVSSGGTVSPSTFTIQVMKQVGGNTPVDVTPTATGGTIQVKHGHNTVVPSTQYKSGQTITVDGSKNYITVQLYVGGTKIGTETLLILHDGKNGTNGEDGAQGRQGPAVRGPVDWRDQTTSRRWCNGTLTNASYPEDGQFMDIVVFDGTYYQCKTSYNGKGGTTAPSSTYWTQVDTQYKFVATDLLLAKNAKINFQTSNELYLMDEDGNVTAGAAGGDGISFWAGANEPTNGAFKVYYNGTMESTKGKFGPLEIGVDTWSDGLLKGTHTQGDGTINTLRLQPHMLSMEADDENGNLKSSVRIGPHADTDRYDMEGDIFVELADNKKTAIATNGQIDAGGYKSGTNFTPFSPLDGLVISFITDINYFTKSGGYWFWKGMPLTRRFTASAYPYVKVINGEWCLCYSSSSTTGVGTGIYGTAHTKSNNKIYIVI